MGLSYRRFLLFDALGSLMWSGVYVGAGMIFSREVNRLIEAMGLYHPVPTQISGGELDETDDLHDAPPQFPGGVK